MRKSQVVLAIIVGLVLELGGDFAVRQAEDSRPSLLGVGEVIAEPAYSSVSATASSQTVTFTSVRTSIMVCNYGSNEIYYRLFTTADTAAAVTTANGVLLVAGSSTNPACKAYDHNPRSETGQGYSAISIVCDTAETATATVESK